MGKNFTIGKFRGRPELRYHKGRTTIMTDHPLISTELDPKDFKHYQVEFIVGNDVITYRRGLRTLDTANKIAKQLAKKYGWKTSLLR